MTKKQIIKKLKDLNIEFDANLSAPDLKDLLDSVEEDINEVNINIQEEVLNAVKEELEPIQEERKEEVKEETNEELKEVKKVYSGITLRGNKWITKDEKEFFSIHEAAEYQGGLI